MLIEELIDYKFTKTDFIVNYYLNKQDMGISEIIEKTGYSRDTVNSTIKRMLANKMIERYEGENGKFIYRVPENMFIDFYEYPSRIIDYMIDNHQEIMTPNICRLLCYLLAYQSYNVPELISDGWKQAATYSSTSKLYDAGIIDKDEDGYVFSKKIRNIAKKPDEYKSVKVGSFNIMGYKHEDTYRERFDKFLRYRNKAHIWGIQEHILSAYPNLDETLKKYGLKMIYPVSYAEKNSNYMIAPLIVVEDYYNDYEMLTLGEDILFNLRYTYVKMNIWNGRTVRILNVHVPQSCGVDEKRKKEIKEFWKLIVKEAKMSRKLKEEFILLGDFNAYCEEDAESENAEYLKRLSDIMFDMFEDWDVDLDDDFPDDWGYTWYSENGTVKRRLDYIFTNYMILDNNIFSYLVDEVMINEGISDHKAIIMEYCLLDEN